MRADDTIIHIGSLAISLLPFLVSVREGASQGVTGPYKLLPSHSTFQALYGAHCRVADLDRDGANELIFCKPYMPSAGQGGGPLFLQPDGSGRFHERACVLVGHPTGTLYLGTSTTVAVGDVNGDGWIDVVSPQFFGSGCPPMVFLNDRTGTPRYHPNSGMDALGVTSNGAELIDVDGDGDLDLFLFNQLGVQDRLLLNDGTGRFTDVSATHLPAMLDDTLWVAAADVDGDGDQDLVVAVRHQPVLVLSNDGTGRFSVSQQLPVVNANFLRLGDLDGDGFPDAYVSTGPMQHDVLLRNDGTGRLHDHSFVLPFSASSSFTPVEMHDLDRDGRLDIVLGRPSGLPNAPWPTVWRNEGSWRFTDISAQIHRSEITGQRYHLWLAITDADRDGDEDLVVGFGEYAPAPPLPGPGGRILFNLTRQIEAPATIAIGSTFSATAHARRERVVFPFLGLTRRDVTIPGLGSFGLDPLGVVALPPVPIGTAGSTAFGFPIPGDPSLRGRDFHLQGIDAGGSPLTAVPTSWTTTRIQ